MKRFAVSIALVMLLFVTSCGQGGEQRGAINEPNKEEEPSLGVTDEVEVMIAASTEEEAVELILSFLAEKLEPELYSGLYLAHEPKKHLVVLIQELKPHQELADALADYSQQVSGSSGEFPVVLKPAKYSYQTLENIMDQLNAAHEELIVTERHVLSYGINEMENQIDLYVSAREDLNEELVAEITAGKEGILTVEEGVMSSLDENGLPTADPYIIGTIKEDQAGENRVLLIDDQIYVSVNGATVIKDRDGNTLEADRLVVGDEVAVWTDGGILESLPASGYAVAIQLQ